MIVDRVLSTTAAHSRFYNRKHGCQTFYTKKAMCLHHLDQDVSPGPSLRTCLVSMQCLSAQETYADLFLHIFCFKIKKKHQEASKMRGSKQGWWCARWGKSLFEDRHILHYKSSSSSSQASLLNCGPTWILSGLTKLPNPSLQLK